MNTSMGSTDGRKEARHAHKLKLKIISRFFAASLPHPSSMKNHHFFARLEKTTINKR